MVSHDQLDMLRKTEWLVKCHIKVTNREREDNMRKGSNQQIGQL